MEIRGAAPMADDEVAAAGLSSTGEWQPGDLPRLVLHLPFEADVSAPARARAAVSAALHSSPHLDVITLMVSELVTNAVVHTGQAAELRVLELGGGDLRVEVHDRNGDVPTPTPTTGPRGGFGLRIVGAHARAWGASVRHDGKVVWFEVGGATGGAGPAGT